jgi:hypothetical protein
MMYLKSLRVVSIIAFAAGAYWLAEYHHQDAKPLNYLAVIIPFLGVVVTNVLIIRALRAQAGKSPTGASP